ncbi:hypothetical protein GGTG_08587 [Gaeumannomyces tritici R3-111a-1]|uniref:Uncharacterized protein n=1 Tax=Gaeumannomyces tritici (strain R3-111a-1) TaxID=644352 RepID=J3P501_GAET3|nr:hypothetical protein GGTG_08587 [Gaeumannomyces tritici R3-111a-1]EJT74749.1 hypothetical protein GGTG_08587 [Gaeumannomyces tritici R3-111a-1]
MLRHRAAAGGGGALLRPTGPGGEAVVPGPRPAVVGARAAATGQREVGGEGVPPPGCPIAAASDREERRNRSMAKGLKYKFVGRRAADGHGDCDTTF